MINVRANKQRQDKKKNANQSITNLQRKAKTKKTMYQFLCKCFIKWSRCNFFQECGSRILFKKKFKKKMKRATQIILFMY